MENNSTSGGTSLLTLVFIVFLVLKLLKVIDWSWWWVTAPLWGGIIVIVFGVFIITLINSLR